MKEAIRVCQEIEVRLEDVDHNLGQAERFQCYEICFEDCWAILGC